VAIVALHFCDLFSLKMNIFLPLLFCIGAASVLAMSSCASSQISTQRSSQDSLKSTSQSSSQAASTVSQHLPNLPPASHSAPPHSAPSTAPPILGKISWADWKKNAGWLTYTNPAYTPSVAFAERIEEDINSDDFSFVLFAGSWCDDSQSELPKLFQVFELANVPLSKITMYGVDENKNDPTGTAQKYGVYKVPTLIAFKKNVEAGRIIEHPRTSWESDITVIMQR
jgi:thiol-disulfide isomerase/thioredoxin